MGLAVACGTGFTLRAVHQPELDVVTHRTARQVGQGVQLLKRETFVGGCGGGMARL